MSNILQHVVYSGTSQKSPTDKQRIKQLKAAYKTINSKKGKTKPERIATFSLLPAVVSL